MPHLLIPSYDSLLEVNHCHGKGTKGHPCEGTRVGITSQRPKGTTNADPDKAEKTNRTVFQQMRAFEAQLKALPGVSNVSVTPGLGAWQDDKTKIVGSEGSWQVSYRGNGAARKLLAKTGQRYDQDAVLLMHSCKGSGCDPAVEIAFDRPVGRPVMDKIGAQLGARGFGGWTWGKRGGKTVLRVVHVPAWTDMTAADHVRTLQGLASLLAGEGLTNKVRVKAVKSEPLHKSEYADLIRGE